MAERLEDDSQAQSHPAESGSYRCAASSEAASIPNGGDLCPDPIPLTGERTLESWPPGREQSFLIISTYRIAFQRLCPAD